MLLVCCVWDTLVTDPEVLLVEGDELFIAPLLFPPDDSVCPTSESDIWLKVIGTKVYKREDLQSKSFQDSFGRYKSTDLT